MAPDLLPAAAVVVLVLAAVYTDLRYGKIYNFMTIPAVTLGMALNVALHGPSGLGIALGGIGVALAAWVAGMALGGRLGGGDVKLLAAVGALCGARFLVTAFVVAAFAGGLLAVLVALRRRELLSTLRRCALWLACRLGLRCPVAPAPGESGLRIPYALPIALGVVGSLLATPVGRGW